MIFLVPVLRISWELKMKETRSVQLPAPAEPDPITIYNRARDAYHLSAYDHRILRDRAQLRGRIRHAQDTPRSPCAAVPDPQGTHKAIVHRDARASLPGAVGRLVIEPP